MIETDSAPQLRHARRSTPLLLKMGAIAGILFGAVTGCAAGGASAPERTPRASATASPDATEPLVERFEGTDFERTDPLPAELEVADQATPAEFALLPKSEQLRWATWAGQYKEDFVAYFHSLGTEPSDAPYTLTANSDALALIVDRSYQQRIAANFGMGSPTTIQTNGPINRQMVEKYLTAFTVASDDARDKISEFASNAGDSSGQALNVVQQFRLGLYSTTGQISASQDFVSISNRMVVDGESIPCFRVSWTAADGSSTSDFNIGAYSTVDYKNQPIVVAMVSY